MTKKISTFFTDGGAPKTGLSPTIRIRNLSTGSLVVTDAAMTESGDGFYYYDFTSYDEELEYSIRCDGTATITNSAERYTYAGNESYMEDILDATASDHVEVGSIGAAIGASGGGWYEGTPVEGGKARTMTKEEAETIAKMVWEVMIGNDKKAKDVLLTRSDFNAIKDKVTLSKNSSDQFIEELRKLTKEIDKVHTEISGGKTIMTLNTLSKRFESVAEIPEWMTKKVESIIETIDSISYKMGNVVDSASVINSTSDSLSRKVDSIKSELSVTNMDFKRAQELSEALKLLERSLPLIVSLADKVQIDEKNRALLKRTALNMNSLKFMMLDNKLRK